MFLRGPVQETTTGRLITHHQFKPPPHPRWGAGGASEAGWEWRDGSIVWAPRGASIAAQADYRCSGSYLLDGSMRAEDLLSSKIRKSGEGSANMARI